MSAGERQSGPPMQLVASAFGLWPNNLASGPKLCCLSLRTGRLGLLTACV
jgi:hypothetical protein